MTRPDARPVPLDAVGVVVARRSDGVVVLLKARGPVVDLHVRTFRDLIRLVRSAPAREGRDRWARRLSHVGDHAGLKLRLCLRNREVARLAAGSPSCRISRALGLSSTTLRVSGIFRAMITRALPLSEFSQEKS